MSAEYALSFYEGHMPERTTRTFTPTHELTRRELLAPFSEEQQHIIGKLTTLSAKQSPDVTVALVRAVVLPHTNRRTRYLYKKSGETDSAGYRTLSGALDLIQSGALSRLPASCPSEVRQQAHAIQPFTVALPSGSQTHHYYEQAQLAYNAEPNNPDLFGRVRSFELGARIMMLADKGRP